MAYLTAAQVRARKPQITNPTLYPDASLAQYVTGFEELAEQYLSVAFTTRTAVETFYRPHRTVVLAKPRVQAITSYTVDGTAGVVSTTALNPGSGILVGDDWVGADILVVTYTHGYVTTPETVLAACAEYVRACVTQDNSGTSRDVIGQSFDGGYTRYSTPDWNAGRPTGFLEVDRLLNSVQKLTIADGIA